MNKLEGYRNDKGYNFDQTAPIELDGLESAAWEKGDSHGFIRGFDAVIRLELPVKFAQWFDSSQQSFKNWHREYNMGPGFGRDMKVEKAYIYWIAEIFKP